MAARQLSIAPAKLLMVIASYVLLTTIILINAVSIKPTLNNLYDFGSFIAAGKEAVAGGNPYSLESPRVFQVASQITGQILPSPNLNPPVSVVFLQVLADVDPMRAVSNWRIISTIIFLIGILLLGWYYRPFTTPLRILWAICLAGFWITVSLGQIYAPLFLLTAGIWILLEKGRSVLAGVLIGILIAIKPNFAFWLLLLGLAGHTSTIFSGAISFVVLSIAPMFFLGSQIYEQWIIALLEYPSLGLMIAGNSSLQSLTARLGIEALGVVLSVILAGSTLYHTHQRKPSTRLLNSLGIISSILISPFSWPGYTVLALPIFFSKPHWKAPDKLAAACLAFPYVVILIFFQASWLSSILFGWLYGWGLILILLSLIVERKSQGGNLEQRTI